MREAPFCFRWFFFALWRAVVVPGDDLFLFVSLVGEAFALSLGVGLGVDLGVGLIPLVANTAAWMASSVAAIGGDLAAWKPKTEGGGFPLGRVGISELAFLLDAAATILLWTHLRTASSSSLDDEESLLLSCLDGCSDMMITSVTKILEKCDRLFLAVTSVARQTLLCSYWRPSPASQGAW
jgi:hypothetical protein